MVLYDEYDPHCPPFHSSIAKVTLTGFHMPTAIQPYDGTSDPDEHLRKFYVHMMLYYGNQLNEQFRRTKEAFFCRAFLSTLKGSALCWFFTLPPNSIKKFVQLTPPFLRRFNSSKTTTITSLCLKQGDDESLKDYVARCKQEAEEAYDICGRDYIRLVIDGLKSGSFKESVVQKPPLKLKDLWKRAQQFVDKDRKKQPSQHCSMPRKLHNLFMKMTTSKRCKIATSDKKIPLLKKI